MSTVDDLRSDLTRCLPLTHVTQIGRAITTNAENRVATFAAFGLEDDCAALE